MITPDRIPNLKRLLSKPGAVSFDTYAKSHALEYIEQLEVQLPKWISVEERLPDIDAEVLIYTNEGLYNAAQYSGEERFWTLERNPDCWVTALGVTHWMLLPEAPKE